MSTNKHNSHLNSHNYIPMTPVVIKSPGFRRLLTIHCPRRRKMRCASCMALPVVDYSNLSRESAVIVKLFLHTAPNPPIGLAPHPIDTRSCVVWIISFNSVNDTITKQCTHNYKQNRQKKGGQLKHAFKCKLN